MPHLSCSEGSATPTGRVILGDGRLETRFTDPLRALGGECLNTSLLAPCQRACLFDRLL